MLLTGISKIEMTTPVVPQLRAALREQIIRNQLAPGTQISESEIAAAFEVSRQPVREAFIKLAEEGLLEIRPQRGTFVRRISTAAVMDARFIREAIEADIVKLLAQTNEPSLGRELKAQLAEQRRAAKGDADRFIQLDEMFHRTLAEAAGRAGAWRILEGLKAQMDRVRYLSLISFPMGALLEQHIAIAAAIASGDPEAAESAMRGHLREILKDLPAVAKKKPELFDTSGA